VKEPVSRGFETARVDADLPAEDAAISYPAAKERLIAAGAIAVIIRVLHGLLVSRTTPLHDTRLTYETFHAFYTSLLRYHELPLWFSEMRYGITSQFQLLLSVSVPKMLAAVYGVLVGDTNTLRLFYLALDVELFIFAFGAYLLGRTLYQSRAAVGLLTLSCLLSTFYLWQVTFDFLLIVWLPLTLYLLRLFAARADTRALLGAVLVTLISLIGNIPYVPPIYLFLGIFFATFVLHEAGVLRHPMGFLSRLRENMDRHRWSNAILLSVLALVLIGYIVTIAHALDHLYVSAPGRAADGTVSLGEFLTYGYDRSFVKLLELVFAVPSNPDARLFPGYVNLAFFAFAVICVRRRSMTPFAWSALLFILLSLADATIFPMLIYNLIPAANRFRHIGLLLPVARLMIFCVAGFGLDSFLRSIDHAKVPPDRLKPQILLAATSLLLLCVILIGLRTNHSIPYSAWWTSRLTAPEDLHWISFLAGLIVIVTVLRVLFSASTRRAPVAGLILLAAILELTSYQLYLYRSDFVRDNGSFGRVSQVGGARLSLWREMDVLPEKRPYEQWLRDRPGTRYATQDLLLGINRCAPDHRGDYHNLYVGQLASIANGSPQERGYPLENPNLDGADPRIRRLLGCSNPPEGTYSGPYTTSAAQPAPLSFALKEEAVVQGVELVFDEEHPENNPAELTVLGSRDNMVWVPLFAAPSSYDKYDANDAVASRSWWFKNDMPYAWYRIAFKPLPNGPATLAIKAALLKTDDPMIHLSAGATVVNSYDDAKREVARWYGPHSESNDSPPLIIEAPPGTAAGNATDGAPDSLDSVSLMNISYNRTDVEAHVGAGGRWLVYSDGWHPGWEARVDGVSEPVRRANLAFKAVWLPPGTHHVSFEFHNPLVHWAYAGWMGIAAACVVLGLPYLIVGTKGLE
jgi:hypothetical protein